MPTYQYICKTCNHELEELQAITDPPLVTCPSCGTDNLVRTVGSGAGVIFKGSGFYLTDYVKKQDKKGTTPEKKKDEKKPDATPSSDASPGSSEKKE